MKSSLLKFILLVSLALNFSVIGATGYIYFKQSGYWMSPFGKKMQKDRFIFEELSLKPQQLKEMKARAIRFRSEIDRERLVISQKRKELIALMRLDAPDIDAIEAVISEINRMQGEMQRMIVMHMLDVKSGLDKEQQKKFLDLIENAMTEGKQI